MYTTRRMTFKRKEHGNVPTVNKLECQSQPTIDEGSSEDLRIQIQPKRGEGLVERRGNGVGNITT